MKQKINNFSNTISKLPQLTNMFIEKLSNNLSLKDRLLIIGAAALFFVALIWVLGSYYLKHTKITPAYGGIYIEGIVGMPEYLNPALAGGNETDLSISKMVFSSIMKYDKDNNLIYD